MEMTTAPIGSAYRQYLLPVATRRNAQRGRHCSHGWVTRDRPTTTTHLNPVAALNISLIKLEILRCKAFWVPTIDYCDQPTNKPHCEGDDVRGDVVSVILRQDGGGRGRDPSDHHEQHQLDHCNGARTLELSVLCCNTVRCNDTKPGGTG